MEKTKLYIIAYAALGKGLSGSDNILIELSRRWADKLDITICGGEQIKDAANNKGLEEAVMFDICPSYKYFKYLFRMWEALKFAFRFKDGVVYTASDFPHDLLVGWVIKLRRPSVRWIAGYYLIASPPFSNHSPYRGFAKIRGIGYWLMQRFTLPIVNKCATMVYLTSEPDRKHFRMKRCLIIKGGVSLPKPFEKPEVEYDAIFMGRFHYQKGVMELVDIWRKVVDKIDAKLFMIGDGVLFDKCLEKVIYLGLQKNIKFFPFASDTQKDYYFKRSKIILHPATYDSGGMSAAEGMAYGLPCVGFNLPAYQTYYKRGMIKVNDKDEFAEQIIALLKNKAYYDYWAKEAFDYIKEEWDWDTRAKEIYNETYTC